ncbi:PREDICTED: 26.5 kDa heat shock protein, mitochondrial [Nicotiana attenuata]|uniref:26.5 kDa heat shock protein, mitochondrial n=1 Tax=Nicotiana attenuata TaxID=49451 RepID=UPI0009052B1C|nr:PREDICTED: 26.5 kDa heat shock protein, mitochondrial [Nicotiana attenuata]
MALARLALKNVQQRMASSPSTTFFRNVDNLQKLRWSSQLVKRFSTAGEGENRTEKREVAVSEGGKKSKLFPRGRGRGSLWRRHNPDFAPALLDVLPVGLGNALIQASENINRLFENLNVTQSQLMGRYKEDNKSYKIKYAVPGLGKEDVKITVEDGILSTTRKITMKGERKEEQEEGSNDEFWSSRSYGYYDNSIVLPEDAKVDEIKAEMKDGVLTLTIPRT